MESEAERDSFLCQEFYDFTEEEILDAPMMEEESDLDTVSRLQKTERYMKIIQKIEIALQDGSNQATVLEDYELVADCNELSCDIENEIGILHNFIRVRYGQKFPELALLVQHPVDYAHVVRKMGNDTMAVDLEEVLPIAVIMAVSIAALVSTGKAVEESVLKRTIEACDRTMALDEAKIRILEFVESRMWRIAPNLSSVVGTTVAAQLMCTAGGLTSLATMPACILLLLGAKRHIPALAGFSSMSHVGDIGFVDTLHSTPPALHSRACRLLASKAALAARMDSTKADPSGAAGLTLRQDIWEEIEKWQD